LFSKTVPDYRSEEWITVWSSVPINHNVTIGMPTTNSDDKNIMYKLVVENSGELNLYDALGIIIWSPIQTKAQHKNGYKFPEVYLVPTNFITPSDSDKHNSLNVAIMARKDSYIHSLNKGCRFLKPNEALKSPNDRFKAILEPSGNFVIKDFTRTMWETATSNLPFAKAPYQLVLNPNGNIMILDSNFNIIWLSVKREIENSTGPYQVEMLDEGKLVVRDRRKKFVWESWPINNMSFGLTFFKKVEYRFVHCHGKPPRIKYILVSNGDNILLENEILKSENKKWELLINNKKKLLLRSANFGKPYQRIIYDSEIEIKSLVLKESGQLVLLCNQNKTLWSTYESYENSFIDSFKMILENSGNIQVIKGSYDDILWSFPKPVNKDFNEDFENSVLDKSKWDTSFDLEDNNNSSKIENYLIENGLLIIKNDFNQNNSFTTLNLKTKKKFEFLFGNFEWKMRLPLNNSGTIYSFILSSHNKTLNQSISIRNLLIKNRLIFSVVNENQIIQTEFELGVEQEFQIFSLIWEPNFLAFHVNSLQILKICDRNNIPKAKMFIELETSGNYFESIDVDYIKFNHLKKESKLKSSLEIYSYKKIEDSFREMKKNSIHECWQECYENIECKAISFLWDVCHLFDSNYTSINLVDEKWTSIIKTCDQFNSSTISYNLKLYKPIKVLNSLSSLECQKHCEHYNIVSKCLATSFKDDLCLLFDSNYEFSRKIGWLSQTPEVLNLSLFKTYPKIRFSSEPLQTLVVENETSCWNSCLELLNCVSTSFSNQKECNLYESEELEYTEDNNWTSYCLKSINNMTMNGVNTVTGSIRYNDKTEPIIYQNVQFANYFNSFENYSETNCWDDCINNEFCESISYSNTTCQFFGNASEYIRINSWTSKSFRIIDLEEPLVYKNIKLSDSYKVLNKSSGINCWIEECLKDDNCTAVSFIENECSLFNSNYHHFDAPNWFTFVTKSLV
jgi:hypothetical protein